MAKRLTEEEKEEAKNEQKNKKCVIQLRTYMTKRSQLPAATAWEVAWSFFYGTGQQVTHAWRIVSKLAERDGIDNSNSTGGSKSQEETSRDIKKSLEKFLDE